MARPNEDVHKLWEMSRDDFNQWRRQNDLSSLLAFFKRVLPHFEEWQSAYRIDDEKFLVPTQPSKFFPGTETIYLHSSTGPDEYGNEITSVYFHARPHDPVADRASQQK